MSSLLQVPGRTYAFRKIPSYIALRVALCFLLFNGFALPHRTAYRLDQSCCRSLRGSRKGAVQYGNGRSESSATNVYFSLPGSHAAFTHHVLRSVIPKCFFIIWLPTAAHSHLLAYDQPRHHDAGCIEGRCLADRAI
jgi:hypothetical protein